MSLSSFLKNNKDVRERFKEEFKKPRFSVSRELLAPPQSRRYMLVGTAFDYLLRFYVKFLNPTTISRQWVAESAIASPLSPLLKNVVLDAESGEISYTETNLTRRVKEIIENAKNQYGDFLNSGEISDKLVQSTLLLGQLDNVVRSGIIDDKFGVVFEEDVNDLHQLISNVPSELFKSHKLCVLNPTFGEGTRLVNGADADIIKDDVLIDIKTTKNLEMRRVYFDQLIGYYVLNEIGGIDQLKEKHEIKKLAVYFSRHAYLHLYNVDEIIDKANLQDFIKWFIDRAKREFHT